MKKLFPQEFKRILSLFIIWRVSLFVVAFLATTLIPNFGARFPYYNNLLIPTGLPSWIWGFGNFDGVHFLRIAMLGYEGSNLSQAFFPLYPLLIKIFAFGNQWFLSGFIVANIFSLFSLFVFYKLVKLDFNEKVAWRSVLLLIVFPTSFYLGSIYSESLFIFLTISSIYLLRRKNYLGAGLLGGMAAATRLVGLILVPLFLAEIYQRRGELKDISKKEIAKYVASIGLVGAGFLSYVYFLQIRFANPLYFLSAPSQFGTGRENMPLVLLPQVLFRYFKMLVSTPVISLPFLNAALEVLFTVIPLALLVLFFKRMRLSYWFFTLTCLVIPTLTGTFTSMPRYALVSFLLLPLVAQKTERYFYLLILSLVLLGAILLGLFIRGYWVA